MIFLWGLQDSVVNTHMSEILGFEFDDKVKPYSIFNIIQSISVFAFLSIEAFVRTKLEYLTFNAIAGLLGLAMCSVTLYFPYKGRESFVELTDER